MATLLAWIGKDGAPLDDRIWRALVARAQDRGLYRGREISGAGWRVFAARTHASEAAPWKRGAGGSLFLLDRSEADSVDRDQGEWSEARLMDGRPTAAIRIGAAGMPCSLHRDLMGRRGLYYASVSDGLLVASGVDVLRAHPQVDDRLDESFLAALFAGLSPAPEQTVFLGVRSLAAGENRVVDGERTHASRLHLDCDRGWLGLDPAELIARFRDAWITAVRRSVETGVKVGISLSAGLDSSAIAAATDQIDGLANRTLAVTRILANFPNIDECADALRCAEWLGLQSRSFFADETLGFGEPESRALCPDTPPQTPYRVWKAAATAVMANAGVELCLDGGGADSLYAAGMERAVDACRQGKFAWLAIEISTSFQRRGWKRTLTDTALRRPVSRLLGRVNGLPERLRWLPDRLAEPIRDRLRAELAALSRFPWPEHAHRVLGGSAQADACGELWFLRRHGIEHAQPYRDPDFVRLCLSLPGYWLERGGQPKWLMREAMRGLLPESIRTRPKGSDLMPVFRHAMLANTPALASWLKSGERQRERLLRPNWRSIAIGDGPEVADWLALGFGGWRERYAPYCA